MPDPLHLDRVTRLPGLIYRSQPFELQGFEGPRPLSLWLPPDYFKTEQPWPLAIFFDGQNLFDDEGTMAGGWQLHTALQARADAGLTVPVVVGLHHGPDRDAEMSPFDPYPGKRGQGKQLLTWLHEELFPRLLRKLRIENKPANTLVAGSSLGGLMALYALFHHPERYGKGLVMSPALWPGRFEIIQALMVAKARAGAQLYLDHGQREGEPPWGPILYQQSEMLSELLQVMGFESEKTLRWVADPEGEHNETCWARRLPQALNFLYGGPHAPATRD